MSRPGIGLVQQPTVGIGHEQLQKLIGRLRLAEFMELSERDFREILREVESDPLFRRLLYPDRPEERAISCRRFPRGDLSRRCFELREDTHLRPPADVPDPAALLAEHRAAIGIIQKIGMDTFRRYFLHGEDQLTVPELARRTGLTIPETRTVIELMDEVFINADFAQHTPSMTAPAVRYACVASLERIDGRFVIGFHHPSYVRGRYTVHYDRIRQLKESGVLDREERRKLNTLVKRIELLNARKHLVYQVLEAAVEIQESYLLSGNPRDLKPFLLKELAAKIGVDNSLITRCIQEKSVETPWGEKPIRFFFPNRKEIAKYFVAEIVERENDALSDEQIRTVLRERYHIDISRRSVNAYRTSMRIASSYRRADKATNHVADDPTG